MSFEDERITPFSFNEEVRNTRINVSGDTDYKKGEFRVKVSIGPNKSAGIDIVRSPVIFDNNTLRLPDDSEETAEEVFNYARELAAQEEDPDMVHMFVRKKIREIAIRIIRERNEEEEREEQAQIDSLDKTYEDSVEIAGFLITTKWFPTNKRSVNQGEYRLVLENIGPEGKIWNTTEDKTVNWVNFRTSDHSADVELAKDLFQIAKRIAEQWSKDGDKDSINEDLLRYLDTICSDKTLRTMKNHFWQEESINGRSIILKYSDIYSPKGFILSIKNLMNKYGDPIIYHLGENKEEALRNLTSAKATIALAKDDTSMAKMLSEKFSTAFF